MDALRWVLVLHMLGSSSGCAARELAWLVPRASVGFALHSHEGGVASAGFVTLVAPLQRTVREPRPFGTSGMSTLHLLGASTRCALVEVCRWEGRARAGSFADLVADESLEMGDRP